MSTQWFANRGQAIQTSLALAAVIIGLVAVAVTAYVNWPTLRPAVFSLGTIFFYVLAGLALIATGALGYRIYSLRNKPKAIEFYPPHLYSASYAAPEFEADTKIFTTDIGQGELFEFQTPWGTGKLILRAISELEKNALRGRPNVDDPDYAADLEIAMPYPNLVPGNKVTQLSLHLWRFAQHKGPELAVDRSLFNIDFDENSLKIVAVRVRHINPYAGKVTLVICTSRSNRSTSAQ
jgi:hypothetical protein